LSAITACGESVVGGLGALLLLLPLLEPARTEARLDLDAMAEVRFGAGSAEDMVFLFLSKMGLRWEFEGGEGGKVSLKGRFLEKLHNGGGSKSRNVHGSLSLALQPCRGITLIRFERANSHCCKRK
jgi:hypothetical protein